MEKTYNMKKNYIAFAFMMIGAGVFTNVSAQTQQSNLATQLQRGGVTVINGYNGQSYGNGYRSQAAYQNYQNYQNQMNNRNSTPTAQTQPVNSNANDDEPVSNNSSGIYTDPKNAQANANMLDGVNKMTQDAKQALATLNKNAGIQDDTTVNNQTVNNAGNTEKKKKATPSLKVTGPKVEKVGISAFNQNTIHEMEAYGKQKEQSEYLKFRMMADSHKNKPIQIRTP